MIEAIHREPSGLVIYHVVGDFAPAGHVYKASLPAPLGGEIRLNFQQGPIPAHGVNGLTNEALLAVLIHRTEVLDSQFPCTENKEALNCMRAGLDWFNQRTASRQARGVEGKEIV